MNFIVGTTVMVSFSKFVKVAINSNNTRGSFNISLRYSRLKQSAEILSR